MLHRLRSVLVTPGRDRLSGTVEVDETYIGDEEPGLSGGRAKGKKVNGQQRRSLLGYESPTILYAAAAAAVQ